MSRSRVVAILLVLACGILVVLLTARSRERADPVGISTSSSTAGSEAAADALEIASRERDGVRMAVTSPVEESAPVVDASPGGLRIRSAERLALAFVELESEPGRWERRELVEGVCKLDAASLPCGVRAPGHLARLAERIEDEVVLEADALLVLEAPGLKQCVTSVAPYAWLATLRAQYAPELRANLAARASWGFTSDDRWAIAVAGSGLGASFGHRHEVQIDLLDRRYRLTQIEFDALPGARGRWTVPCLEARPVAPLAIEIVRPTDGERGHLECALAIVRDDDTGLTRIDQAWGKVELQPGVRFQRDIRLAPDEDGWRVDAVPLGEQAVLSLRDLVSSAHAQLVFVHDGTPRRVVLSAGFELVGRLAVPAGCRLPATARLACGRLAGGSGGGLDPEYQASGRFEFPIAPDGAFLVRGPQGVPRRAGAVLDRPATIGLEIEAVGFDVHRSTWPLGAAMRVDCGTIALVPSPAPIVLAPGHDIESLAWHTLYAGPERAQVWTIRTGRSEPDGSMGLVFDDDWLARNEPSHDHDEAQAELERARAALPVAAAIPALVIELDDHSVAFERVADGRYGRVADREYAIECVGSAIVADESTVTLGWRWRGIPQEFAWLGTDRAGERRTLSLRAPREGTTLWWSTDGELGGDARAGAGFVPLDSPSMTVKLP